MNAVFQPDPEAEPSHCPFARLPVCLAAWLPVRLRDADNVADGDAVALEPALRRLEAEKVWSGRVVVLRGVRFHVLDMDDGAALVDEGDGEVDEGVLHPEAAVAREAGEEHAGVVRDFGAPTE